MAVGLSDSDVENFDGSLLSMKNKGLLPDSTEKFPAEGQFAHFHDPDGNEVTIWEEYEPD